MICRTLRSEAIASLNERIGLCAPVLYPKAHDLQGLQTLACPARARFEQKRLNWPEVYTSSCRVSHRLARQNGSSPACRTRARDTLDHGFLLSRSANQRW